MIARRSLLSCLWSFPVAFAPRRPRRPGFDFQHLMQTLADAWNEGDAPKASDCFSDDAVFMDPPDRQVYHGRAALYQFFGGGKPLKPAMRLSWRHLAFDPSSQVGFGEYTLKTNGQYYGVAVVKIAGGKIASWREYQYHSDLSWQLFAGRSYF